MDLINQDFNSKQLYNNENFHSQYCNVMVTISKIILQLYKCSRLRHPQPPAGPYLPSTWPHTGTSTCTGQSSEPVMEWLRDKIFITVLDQSLR